MPHARAPEAEIELPPIVVSARTARQFGTTAVEEWDVDGDVDHGALNVVVSELVTNAIQHGAPPIRLRIRRLAKGVRVEVEDDGPYFDGGGASALGGPTRGLALVATLTRAWGVERLRCGKQVWGELEFGWRRNRDDRAQLTDP